MTIEMAPMQGHTDYVFRRAYRRYFAGVDAVYTPFVLLERGAIRPRDRRELEAGDGACPQIAPADSKEAVALVGAIRDAGINAVNLNLGCPYPMLTKRRRGAGALPHPDLIAELLDALFGSTPSLAVSVKTRLGLEMPTEFEEVIPVLNRFALEKVILHPRVATQKYGGTPHWELFGELGEAVDAPLIANGDIFCLDDARRILDDYPFIKGLMVGRGLLADPFLPSRIKGAPLPASPRAVLKQFHDDLFEDFARRLSPPHLLHRMTAFWAYFADSFPDSAKRYKKIKKAKQVERYLAAAAEAFSDID